MKKLLITSLTCMLLTACSDTLMPEVPERTETAINPYSVSIGHAIETSQEYFALLFHSTRAPKAVKSIEMLNAHTRSNDDMNGYYVVNFEEDGFALLSADKRRDIVLGISDTGSLHLSDTIENKGLSWYLNTYLPAMDQMNLITPKDTVKHDFIYGTRVEEEDCPPMLKGFLSKFHKYAPYNKYCFTPDGKQAPTGCGPLAIGTLIGYYKWPTLIDGYYFNYSDMYKDPLDDGWMRLFEVIGRPKYANTQYYEEFASTSIDREAYALTKLGFRNVEWCAFDKEKVDVQLRNNRPVIVAGQCSEGGHAWIADGSSYIQTEILNNKGENGEPYYEYQYFIHCVWGWGGEGNGFYVFKPTSIGDNYKYDEGVDPNPYHFTSLFEIITAEKP